MSTRSSTGHATRTPAPLPASPPAHITTSIIRTTGRREDNVALPGLLGRVMDAARSMLTLPPDLRVVIDMRHASTPIPGEHGSHAPGLFTPAVPTIDRTTRRVVGTHETVAVYAKDMSETERAYMLAHELGHAQHYARGEYLAASYGAREHYADAVAQRIGDALNISHFVTIILGGDLGRRARRNMRSRTRMP